MTGPKTTKTGEIVPKAKGASDSTLAEMLEDMLPQFRAALPAHLKPERMLRIATTALRVSPDLRICSKVSFLGCVLQAAQLGLEVNTPLGHAYLIPRKQRGLPDNVRNCTMIIGYQGMLELARRSGQIVSPYAFAVRLGDYFEYELGLERTLRHKPSDDPDREDDAKHPITHAYAVARERDSRDPIFTVLSRAQIEKRRLQGASAYTTTPWDQHYEAMALKSAVRALWPWLPKSTEMARAEAVEVGAEQGSQLAAFDPEVHDMLDRAGLRPDEDAPALPSDTTDIAEQLRKAVEGEKSQTPTQAT